MKIESVTDPQLRTLVIEECWQKRVDGVVIRLWRQLGENKWHREKTPYKEIPVVRLVQEPPK